jgi:regulator of protease activity HflC (stomatin/prohibitin superfamily)
MTIGSVLGAIPFEAYSAIVMGIVGFFKSIKFIQEGELGAKLRFGKVVRDKKNIPKIYKPGFVFLIPFVDTLRRHAIRQQTLPFNEQRIMLKNGMTFILSAYVLFRVTDIYKALFDISDLEGSIEDVSTGSLRDKVAQLSHEGLADTEKIGRDVLESIKKHTESWGVEIVGFQLTNCSPSPETVNLLNVPAKISMLDSAAQKLGVPLTEVDHSLLAILIGAPLVTSMQPKTHEDGIVRGNTKRKQEERLSKILQGEKGDKKP